MGGAWVCALYYLLHCHTKQGCQMSKYPTGYLSCCHFIYTNSVASDFCHIWPILPGCPSDFEIGIFLSLRPILCNVMSISQMLTKIRRITWQNWSDSKNQTDFGCFVVNKAFQWQREKKFYWIYFWSWFWSGRKDNIFFIRTNLLFVTRGLCYKLFSAVTIFTEVK